MKRVSQVRMRIKSRLEMSKNEQITGLSLGFSITAYPIMINIMNQPYVQLTNPFPPLLSGVPLKIHVFFFSPSIMRPTGDSHKRTGRRRSSSPLAAQAPHHQVFLRTVEPSLTR
ncbi:hypothetical protein FRC18_003951 [Serendipita sp. 400]|nr:hypothetical protein FRC18_003951 [Serendipita sp. 400]